MNAEAIAILTPCIAGISTLAIYSFLYKENPVYRFFEHLFIGIATAWGLVATVKAFLWPRIFSPMISGGVLYLPDGSAVGDFNYNYMWYLVPASFALLYYTMYSEKYRHLAQLVVSFQLGCAGGLAFKGTFVEVLPQIFNCFKPLWYWDGASTWDVVSNWVFVITLLSAFSYFFFTFKASDHGAVRRVSSLGRYLMMGCFGAFFGATMMARMALLAERLDFLSHEWIEAMGEVVSKIL